MALALCAFGCSASDDTDEKPGAVNCDLDKDAPLAARRSTCEFGPGALPEQTIGCEMRGQRLPFEHVVLIMQENRSFDHYPEAARVRPAGRGRGARRHDAAGIRRLGRELRAQVRLLLRRHQPRVTVPRRMNGGKNDDAKATPMLATRWLARRGVHDASDSPFYYQLRTPLPLATATSARSVPPGPTACTTRGQLFLNTGNAP
jgi:hypothetical protein